MNYSQDQFDEFTRRLLYEQTEGTAYNRGKLNPRWPHEDSGTGAYLLTYAAAFGVVGILVFLFWLVS